MEHHLVDRHPSVRPFRQHAVAVNASAGARKGVFDKLDYQIGWPYAALGLEALCVALHWRAPLALTAVFLVLFQSPSDNALLKAVASSGIFARYKDAQAFCAALTACTFVSFLVVSFLQARV